ncbi:N-acetylglucosamine/diacetylchitobiose ABC transporter substrate-binding protein [Streptomyces sp. NPDC059740]|uniref:N-acetylglucosamine/diacetylchitobiose ABC transporter substrate-binding protein n=1 Tax=Streptomyces sp. NPDC059740 TaxID=3346926 RepID=UPI00365CB4EB
MGSTSSRGGNEGLGRRELMKRAGALGLLAVPALGTLSACASGGGDDSKVAKGKKSAKNPLGVNDSAGFEFVIFDGGYGTEYGKDAVATFKKAHPGAKVDFSSTQKIQSQLQPRFNGGNPPDLIDNQGAEQMDMGVLASRKQLADLTPLLDAPSFDDPSKKVRDTLRPGVVEMGQFEGKACYVLNYAYTVYGVWYSQTNLDRFDAQYPETWDDMLALCAKAKKKGVAGWTYAGKYPYYIPFSLYGFIGKIGGRKVLDSIDNLEPNAWKDPAVKAAFDAYYELQRKGYILHGTPGLTHIESQTAWTEGKALFIPNGSWVENEAAKTTPKNFQMKVGAPSSLDSSDKMPFGTLWASGSEAYIVPSKAKNTAAGMEQLRIMLSEAASKNFTTKVKSLTSFNGGTEGVELTSGLKSCLAALDKAGEANILNPRLQDWYGDLEKQKIGVGVLGEMLAGRMTPDEAVRKCQAAADETAKDDSIQHYKHTK